MDEYKHPISITTKKGCYFRLKFDPMTGGACFGCKYCYRIPLIKRAGRSLLTENLASPQLLFNQLSSALLENQPGLVNDLLRARLPLRLGCMCDPFGPSKELRKRSLDMLRILTAFKYPFLLFTKSDYVASETIRQLLRAAGDQALVHVTVTTNNRKLSKQIEPNAPTPNERMAALGQLVRDGIPAVLRIAPIILGLTEEQAGELIHLFSDCGGRRVVLEQLRAESQFFKFLASTFPQTIKYFNTKTKGIYARYPDEAVKAAFKMLIENAPGIGRILFGICSNQVLNEELCHGIDNCCLFPRPVAKLDPTSEEPRLLTRPTSSPQVWDNIDEVTSDIPSRVLSLV